MKAVVCTKDATDIVNKHLNSLSKKCFSKTNIVYLYDVIKLSNGSLYPIYTVKPYRNYNLISNRRGFPVKCSATYAQWIIDLRSQLRA